LTPLDRRTFLKAAGGGVGALALAGETAIAATSAPQPARQPVGPGNSEIVVVGAGAFGGWTALYLREMGFTVTLVDQYGPGNSRATSGGESRQIRAGYGERELYTRWVLQAFERWRTREAEWGRRLLFQTGQLSLARAWTKDLTDTRKVFDKLGVNYEVIEHDDLARRYPQITIENIDFAMYTPGTGVLKAREGSVAVAQAASPTRTFRHGRSTAPTGSPASRGKGSRWCRPSSACSSIPTRRSTR
jgi:glycine/D-amino acid oxidase-like deaminating enzyme